MNQKERMLELVQTLKRASKAYYANDEEIMSNFEYDALYDELVQLEEATGTILAGSPTIQVGYEAVDELPKERHESPMLSLDKTKSREELRSWLGDKEGWLSWKLDGLTVVLTYEDGELKKAVTRGNGEVGEVITPNALVFQNIPLHIIEKGKIVIRGEAIIRYSDFNVLNEQAEKEKFKNPRNLCSGSVRQLNNEITAKRRVRFYAFALIGADNSNFANSRGKQYEFMERLGFEVVEHKLVNEATIADRIAYFEEKIKTYDIPSDGLVLLYDDIEYGLSLGRTAKFPRDAIAFKWADEICETTLREIEWSPSRTGLINPVAVFKPVEIEGTTVSRASVHNISVMRSLKLGIGDRINVYKANMIIPQIAENLTKSDTIEIPGTCPVCGGKTRISDVNSVQLLYCDNIECPVKKIKAFTHFVSRDALNVDGLSEATLEKFIARGYVHDLDDIFHLDRYREELISMDGFGEKSYENLMNAVNTARHVTVPKLIYALGIANIGLANAKLICHEYNDNIDEIIHADRERLALIPKIGDVIAGTFCDYFSNENNIIMFKLLCEELLLQEEERDNQSLNNLAFVVTGSLRHFKDRSELKDIIESMGGKVSGSISSKTECLINNEITSSSSKNMKAKELGVTILSEEDFMEKYGVLGTVSID